MTRRDIDVNDETNQQQGCMTLPVGTLSPPP